MKEIIGLIIKDCMTLKSYMKTIIFMIILFSVCMYINGDITSFMPVYIPLFFGILAMSSFSYDNLSKSDKYLLTFPVSKKDVVNDKFVYDKRRTVEVRLSFTESSDKTVVTLLTVQPSVSPELQSSS